MKQRPGKKANVVSDKPAWLNLIVQVTATTNYENSRERHSFAGCFRIKKEVVMMMGFGSLIWIVIIGGVIYLVMRRGGGGCCGGGGHDHGGNGGHDHMSMGHNNGMNHQEGHQAQVTDGKDPVCGMSVKDNSITSVYQGHSYSFCSDHCREKFDANPADFIK